MSTLLVVEDDANQRRAVRIGLEARGYRVVEAGDGRVARTVVEVERPDLVLLDLGLPDIDGVDLCRHLRIWPGAPIIVVSAEDDDRRMVDAFAVGADDYVVKPVVFDVLAARIAVHLRYAQQLVHSRDDVITIGGVSIDVAGHAVLLHGRPVDLRPQQHTLLALLMRHVGRLVTHEAINRALGRQGADDEAARKANRLAVHRLRVDLGDGEGVPRIVTEHHVGYRMLAPAPPRDVP